MKRFFWQERVWTCGPASFRIALARLGINKTERYLSHLLKSTPKHGVSNKRFIKAAQSMNLQYLHGHSDLTTLYQLHQDGWQIIVNYYARLHGSGHYAVIDKIAPTSVVLADPASGPKTKFTRKYFDKCWHSNDGKLKKWFFAIKKENK